MTGERAQDQLRVRARGIAAHVRAGTAAFSCPVEEISEDGAFLPTDQRMAAGTGLEIALVKPGGRKALHVKGRVSYVVEVSAGRHPGIDVAFTNTDAAAGQRLSEWLEELRLYAPKSVEPEPVAEVLVAEVSHDARLMLQIKGLLLEADELRYLLRAREAEVADLQGRLAAVEKLLGRRPVRE